MIKASCCPASSFMCQVGPTRPQRIVTAGKESQKLCLLIVNRSRHILHWIALKWNATEKSKENQTTRNMKKEDEMRLAGDMNSVSLPKTLLAGDDSLTPYGKSGAKVIELLNDTRRCLPEWDFLHDIAGMFS